MRIRGLTIIRGRFEGETKKSELVTCDGEVSCLQCWLNETDQQADLVSRDVVVLESVPGTFLNTASQWDRAFKTATSRSDILDQPSLVLKNGSVTFHPSPSEPVVETVFLVPSHSARTTKMKGLNVQDRGSVQAGDKHKYSGPLT